MADNRNEAIIDIRLKENVRDVLAQVNDSFRVFQDVLKGVEQTTPQLTGVIDSLAKSIKSLGDASKGSSKPLGSLLAEINKSVQGLVSATSATSDLSKKDKELADAAKGLLNPLKDTAAALAKNSEESGKLSAATTTETAVTAASIESTTAAAVAKEGLATTTAAAAAASAASVAPTEAATAATAAAAETAAAAVAPTEARAAATAAAAESSAASVAPTEAAAAATAAAAETAAASIAPTEAAAAATASAAAAAAAAVAPIDAAAAATAAAAAAAAAAVVPIEAEAAATAAAAAAAAASVAPAAAAAAATTAMGAAFGAAGIGIAAMRTGLNQGIGSLLNFKTLIVGALATIGLFKAKNFFEDIIGDAADLELSLRRVSAAVGELNSASTNRIKESLKQIAIDEGVSVSSLAAAAKEVIPDIGEKNIGVFIAAAQRFALVAGAGLTQSAENLVFIMKGFNTETEIASDNVGKLAESITDKLYVASKEGNISIGQLTSVIGFAAQQADVLGISFDELLTSITALGDVGIKPMKGFRLINQILANVQNPSADALAAVERLNQALPNLDLDFSNAGLKADGLSAFLIKLSRALKANEGEARALGFSTRELGGLYKITAEDGAKLFAIQEKIQNSGGQVRQADDFIFAGAAGSLEKIQALIGVLKDDLAEVFLPAIEKIFSNYLNGLKAFRDAFGGTVSQIQQVASLINDDPNIPKEQKTQKLAELDRQNSLVRDSAYEVAAEFFLVAFKTGAMIIGDLLLAAFAKGGQLLAIVIKEALGQKDPVVQSARFEGLAPSVREIYKDAPSTATIQPVPSGMDAQSVLVGLNQFARETKAEVNNDPNAFANFSKPQQELYNLLKKYLDKNEAITTQTPEVIKALSLFLQQRNEVNMQTTDLEGNYIRSAPRNISARAGQDYADTGLKSEIYGDSKIVPFDTDSVARNIVYAIANNITDLKSSAISGGLDALAVRGKTIPQFETEGKTLRNDAARENSASSMYVDNAIDRAKTTLTNLTEIMAALREAGDSKEAIQGVMAKVAAEYQPLVGFFINLKQRQEDALKLVNNMSSEVGYFVEKATDGTTRITQRGTEEIKQNINSAYSELLAAKDKFSAVSLQQFELIDKKTTAAVKVLAKLEVDRLRAIGNNGGADAIQSQLDQIKVSESGAEESRDPNIRKQLAKSGINVAEIEVKYKQEIAKLTANLSKTVDIQYGQLIENLRTKQTELLNKIASLPPEQAEQIVFGTTVSVGDILQQQLLSLQKEGEQLIANQINKATATATTTQTEEGRKLVRGLAKEAEKSVIELVTQALKIKSDALRTINNKPNEAAIVDLKSKEIQDLVSLRDKAQGAGLLADVDAYNAEIVEKIRSLSADLPPEIEKIFTAVTDGIKILDTDTSEQIQVKIANMLDQYRDLTTLISGKLEDTRRDITKTTFKNAKEELLKATEAKRYSEEGSIAGLRSQALSTGGFNFESNKIEAQSKALQDIDVLINNIKSSYDKLTPEIQAQLTILEKQKILQEDLLLETLRNNGVQISTLTDENGLVATRVELQQKLIKVQQAAPEVNESLRKTSEELGELNRKYQQTITAVQTYSQGTAGAFIEIPAIIGRGIYPMSQMESATENSSKATLQYQKDLQGLKQKLMDLKDVNPEFAPNIELQIKQIDESMSGVADKIAADGQSAGSRFAAGIQQGLGQAQDFATTLGQGIGGAIQNNIGVAVDSVINGVQSMGEAFQQFVSQTLIDIGSLIIKMLILKGIQMALGSIGFGLPMNSGGQVPETQGYNSGGFVNIFRGGYLALANGGFINQKILPKFDKFGNALLDSGGSPPRRLGYIPGADINQDIVPAMLTPGEFVMRRSAVKNYGVDFMTAINSSMFPKEAFPFHQEVRHFAEGGSTSKMVEGGAFSGVMGGSKPNTGYGSQQSEGKSNAPTTAIVVANESTMESLLRGGKNSMLEFLRTNKRNF